MRNCGAGIARRKGRQQICSAYSHRATGLVYNGPFGRSSDNVGIGFAYVRVGNGARGLDADTAAFTATPYPIRTRETALEISYQWTVSPWWQLQPDFQYIFNPIPNPYTGQKIGNA